MSSEADLDPDGVAMEASSFVSAERQREILLQGPVVRFLCRPDFILRVQQLDGPSAHLLARSSVKHMLSRIRRDHSSFERYQHNRDLVALVNAFACRDKELPPGWESKKDRNGKVRLLAVVERIIINRTFTYYVLHTSIVSQTFFIDHTARTTTFIDPRLPNELPLLPLDPSPATASDGAPLNGTTLVANASAAACLTAPTLQTPSADQALASPLLPPPLPRQ